MNPGRPRDEILGVRAVSRVRAAPSPPRLTLQFSVPGPIFAIQDQAPALSNSLNSGTSRRLEAVSRMRLPQAADTLFPNLPQEESAKHASDGFCAAHVVIVQQTCNVAHHPRKALTISDESDEARLREQGGRFMPKFDANGLLTAVAVDHASGQILMLAHMNAEAIKRTLATGKAHFFSRSRGRLWMKGESSGHVLEVREIRVDCDQDAVELRVAAHGPACHTLANSCFYRRLEADGTLVRTDD